VITSWFPHRRPPDAAPILRRRWPFSPARSPLRHRNWPL